MLPMCPAVASAERGIRVTVYSQHSNRGKVQILATYRGPAGVTSSTVTSVDDAVLAAPIVDALNRISAYATVPVSVWDKRGGKFGSYPAGHLAALTDLSARRDLLEGAHSLWYEQVKTLLSHALTELDDAVAAVPPPVRKAITVELEAEARGLREASAEYSEGVPLPETENRREWESETPFVVVDSWTPGLSPDDREHLDSVEQDITQDQLRKGAADLRLLLDAFSQCVNEEARLLSDGFEITDDPYAFGEDEYFLNVEAPMPNGAHDRDEWNIEISRWVPDDPEDEDASSATGESVLSCVRSAPPTVSEIVELLNCSGGRPEKLAAWAGTAVGDALDGTTFVVTKRYDSQ